MSCTCTYVAEVAEWVSEWDNHHQSTDSSKEWAKLTCSCWSEYTMATFLICWYTRIPAQASILVSFRCVYTIYYYMSPDPLNVQLLNPSQYSPRSTSRWCSAEIASSFQLSTLSIAVAKDHASLNLYHDDVEKSLASFLVSRIPSFHHLWYYKS